jgi:hypothetical protein
MISCRSTVCFLAWRRMTQPVIAGAVGRGLDHQSQSGWRRHWPWRVGIALSCQDVEHDVTTEKLSRQRLGTGRFDRVEPCLGDRRQNIDELAIAVVMPGKPAPDLRQRWRQIPVAEGITVAQRPRLARQHRQAMPGIVGGLTATKAAAVLRDNLAVAPDDDAIGVDSHLRGAPL